jgi:septal ring factor EnvC (AmiA/AmiB activator)
VSKQIRQYAFIPLYAVIAGLLLAGVLAGAQFVPPPPSQAEKDMHQQQLKEANKKRQQDLKSDTDRLFQLATELKAAVDKTNENMLSLEVVRKADEVEKLAKRVREKMKETVGSAPTMEPPPPPRPQYQR